MFDQQYSISDLDQTLYLVIVLVDYYSCTLELENVQLHNFPFRFNAVLGYYA